MTINGILQRGAEIGYDGLAGDGAGFIGGEEQKHVGNVLGHAGLNLEVVVLVK